MSFVMVKCRAMSQESKCCNVIFLSQFSQVLYYLVCLSSQLQVAVTRCHYLVKKCHVSTSNRWQHLSLVKSELLSTRSQLNVKDWSSSSKHMWYYRKKSRPILLQMQFIDKDKVRLYIVQEKICTTVKPWFRVSSGQNNNQKPNLNFRSVI